MEEHGKGFYRRVRDADLLRYSGELVFCEGAGPHFFGRRLPKKHTWADL